MNKRTENKKTEKILIDITSLMEMLEVGRNTALRIGEESGASIKLGKSKRYVVSKIKDYIDSLAEQK